jgi:hypothetical protein
MSCCLTRDYPLVGDKLARAEVDAETGDAFSWTAVIVASSKIFYSFRLRIAKRIVVIGSNTPAA